MIWDKVALDESVILHTLTQNSRNTVLPGTEYFENLVRKSTTATPAGFFCRSQVTGHCLTNTENIPNTFNS